MTDVLRLHHAGTEIVRITADGRIFWREREVATDDEFRSAMMDTLTAFRLSVNTDAQRARMN